MVTGGISKPDMALHRTPLRSTGELCIAPMLQPENAAINASASRIGQAHDETLLYDHMGRDV